MSRYLDIIDRGLRNNPPLIRSYFVTGKGGEEIKKSELYDSSSAHISYNSYAHTRKKDPGTKPALEDQGAGLRNKRIKRINPQDTRVSAGLGPIGLVRNNSPTLRNNPAPPTEAVAGHRGREISEIPPRPDWWRDEFEERAAIREHLGGYTREQAERLAWGELQNRWHRLHGERVSADICAGCRRSIGNAPAMEQIDGNRVHDAAGHDCLIRYGERWRGRATAALVAMGLTPPQRIELAVHTECKSR